MVLIIDNYDSFTYNIYQYVGHFRSDVEVVENDMISISEIKQMSVLDLAEVVKALEEEFGVSAAAPVAVAAPAGGDAGGGEWRRWWVGARGDGRGALIICVHLQCLH